MTGPRALYLMYTGLVEQSGDQALNLHRLRDLASLGGQTWVAAQELPQNLGPDQAGRREEIAALSPSVAVLFFPRRAFWPGRMVKRLVRLCAEQTPDLIVFTQAQNLRSVRALKQATGLPILWDCRGSPRERDSLPCGAVGKARNALLRWAHRPALRLSDWLICVSRKHAEEMSSQYHYDPERITVVPNGVDVGAFRPDGATREAVRKELGIARDELVIVYAGSMHAWQCFRQSVDFVKVLARLRAAVRLLVLTPEVEVARRNLATSQGVVKHVVLSVQHTEMPRYLAAADAGLLLREPDPCSAVASPMKFAEYLACGLAVAIGPDVGDYSDLVRERRLGIVLDPRDRDPWEADGRRLIALLEEDPGAVSQRCRQTALALLSNERERARFAEAIASARACGRAETASA